MKEAALLALTLVFVLSLGVAPALANVGGQVGAEQRQGDSVSVGPDAGLQQLGGLGRTTSH